MKSTLQFIILLNTFLKNKYLNTDYKYPLIYSLCERWNDQKQYNEKQIKITLFFSERMGQNKFSNHQINVANKLLH